MQLEALKKKVFSMKKESLLFVFLIGVLLLVLGMPTSDKQKETEVDAEDEETRLSGFEERMEEKLQALLSEMEGAGEVQVMVTVEDTGESVMGKDSRLAEKESEESTVYQEEGQGRKPFVISSKTPRVQGVVIVCEGAGNPVVKQRISEAVQALFQIESHKISIVKKRK
ncbi:stage III sporulation protein AG [Lachnospiraceae bacterium XBB1006]|nr:stage III sporulation protein AG [Lachnospiraceae bacterium XBB1006]